MVSNIFTNKWIASEACVDNELDSTLWKVFEDTGDDTDVNLTIEDFKVDPSNEETMEVPGFN